MKNLGLLLGTALFASLWFTACEQEPELDNGELKSSANQMKFAVISDLHYMHPSLLVEKGSAFYAYLANDPKMLEQSGAILQEAINQLKKERPQFILIPGDLTKDGEMVSHQSVVDYLHQLTQAGIKVLVIPGNHDINNPDAVEFHGSSVTPVPSVSATEFEQMYQDFGYADALARDAYSLSYVTEPVEGTRIVCIDASRYAENSTMPIVGGLIKPETLQWIVQQVATAQYLGKNVFAMMHHGAFQHFYGQSAIFPDYLVDDWVNITSTLSYLGVKVLFTGHFHSNDVSFFDGKTYGMNDFYDVETGSLAGYPSPYRIVRFINGQMHVNTKYIERIDYPGLTIARQFHDNEMQFSRNGIEIQANYMLTNYPFSLPPQLAQQVVPFFADAMMAHLYGDETPSKTDWNNVALVNGYSAELGSILTYLWTDLPTADNDFVLDLR